MIYMLVTSMQNADAHPKYEAKEKGGGSGGRENHYGMGSQNQRCCNNDV